LSGGAGGRAVIGCCVIGGFGTRPHAAIVAASTTASSAKPACFGEQRV
jgi:hypothetical protein